MEAKHVRGCSHLREKTVEGGRYVRHGNEGSRGGDNGAAESQGILRYKNSVEG